MSFLVVAAFPLSISALYRRRRRQNSAMCQLLQVSFGFAYASRSNDETGGRRRRGSDAGDQALGSSLFLGQ